MGDISIPFFKLSAALATRFHTRCDVLDSRNGRLHLPVVSFFSYLDNVLHAPFGFSVDTLNWLSKCPNYWALQPLCAATPRTPQRASSNIVRSA